MYRLRYLIGLVVLFGVNNYPAHLAVSPLDDESTDASLSVGISDILSLESAPSLSASNSSYIPSLESVHSSDSWVSGTPSFETQKSNAKKRLWWNRILYLDNAAYTAQDPEKKIDFQREAQKLRDEFERTYGEDT